MNDDNYLSINDQGLAEVSPTASRDQQMTFIDNFRQAQGQNNQQIADSIHALGSDLEAPYGGLHGPSDYIRSRYQTPQTESRMAGLRTTAQLAALNQLMQNDLAKWKDKYNQESRNYNKRRNTPSGSGGGNNSDVLSDGTLTVDVVEGLTPQGTGSLRSDEASTRLFTGEYDDQGRPIYKDYDESGNLIRQYEGVKTTTTEYPNVINNLTFGIAGKNLANLGGFLSSVNPYIGKALSTLGG